MGKCGNKSNCIRMHIYGNIQGFQWMILFVEISANYKRFSFLTLIRTKENRK